MPVRVAIIDSGVHASHPHVGGVAGGVAFDQDGNEHDDYVDRLGHGTAVTAAIREKAPDAELHAVRIFDHTLATRISNLIKAIDWAARNGMHVANLSLGGSLIAGLGATTTACAGCRAACRASWPCNWTGTAHATSTARPRSTAPRCFAPLGIRARSLAYPRSAT